MAILVLLMLMMPVKIDRDGNAKRLSQTDWEEMKLSLRHLRERVDAMDKRAAAKFRKDEAERHVCGAGGAEPHGARQRLVRDGLLRRRAVVLLPVLD